MKRALTIYIDDDCEITALSITTVQENQSGKPSITISTSLGTGGKNLYLPFKDERPNRIEPIYFNDGGAGNETYPEKKQRGKDNALLERIKKGEGLPPLKGFDDGCEVGFRKKTY